MNITGKKVQVDDTIYSESMGYGSVISVSSNSIMVNHHGQSWRYNRKLVRQGCAKSDIGWRPKLSGNQIKNKQDFEKAELIINSLAEQLTKAYG